MKSVEERLLELPQMAESTGLEADEGLKRRILRAAEEKTGKARKGFFAAPRLAAALCAVVFLFTGSLIPFLVMGGYYFIIGHALSRFIGVSYVNGVFDKYINPRLEGVEVNRGLARDTDEDDEDEEEAENQDTPQ